MFFGGFSIGSGSYGSENPSGVITNYVIQILPLIFIVSFQEQPTYNPETSYDVFGYVNNPRFTPTPASLVEHKPCGYWFKGEGKAQIPVWTLPK